MRKKKETEKVEEIIEEETVEEAAEQPQKDVKLGEFELKPGNILVVKKTNYNGEDRIDFRVWMNTARYKVPTKQGFVLAMDKIDDFVEMVNKFKEKLSSKNS